MNYLEIDTAEDVLNAFKACQNAGEEIQLFESLAERENPPVDAFVEILRKIKLEIVLALTIQAFGKITNDEVKARLKGSDELLVMLCEYAQSGATDLIKWSAATTIENIGFAFINVCQYLTAEPSEIIQKIVVPKIEILTELERKNYRIIKDHVKKIDEFIVFFAYAQRYHTQSKRGIQIMQGFKRVFSHNKDREGDVFIGRVTRMGTSGGFSGAFVEFLPGREGLIKISEMSEYRDSKRRSEISDGDEVVVEIQEIDSAGRAFLSCLDSNYDKSNLSNYGL